MSSETRGKLEIVRGQFGHMAVYLDDLRIAGEKPWGGGTTIWTFQMALEDQRVRDLLAGLVAGVNTPDES